MKKLIIMVLMCLTFFTSQSHAGIPVIDVTSITQQIAQATHLVSQIAEMKKQLKTAEDTLTNISGSRGMGSVISSIYDPNMAVNVNSILTSNGMQTGSALGVSGDTEAMFDLANNVTAQYLGQSSKTLQQSQNRFTELVKLIAKVNNAPDQKDILDLNARIDAENAMLQNEMIKLTALQAQNEANQIMLQRRREQVVLQNIGEPDDLNALIP